MIQKIAYSSIIDTLAIKNFDCGNSRLNQFFHEEAMETETSGFGNTTIFYDDVNDVIVGFYALSLRSLDITPLVGYQRFKKLYINDYVNNFMQRYDQDKFPVLDVLRFAVNVEHQNKRMGTSMITELYKDILDLRIKYNLPINSIYVDSLYEATDFYENLGFEFITNTDTELILKVYPMMITIDKIISILS